MIATVNYFSNRQRALQVYEAANAELLRDLLIQCLELDGYDTRIINRAFSNMGSTGTVFDLGKERGTRNKKRRITASVQVVEGALTHLVSATYSVDVAGGKA
ncbi:MULTISPECIES: hypothetical protein [Nocardiopsis]|uniref:Uncharacterized protein n=1 Tax=Nocardiopsis sinuspersici TaxID=501010 RepID=A0A1V3BWP7_9ACTN|nr:MULTISPECIES: hypothetical protein [Nocardiopsis]OOC52606.1 hypothetical protein NOSIN_01160 [Nocardiopsis sinuspersici]